jgi:2-polyprenyl-6-hydroxyphenyl methylase/3-demethylubiquinone-9 3-methyltransferase
MGEVLREVAEGKRFNFGKNWNRFLTLLDEGRIQEAEKSLKQMLEVENLDSKLFLDMGSGSGLFSLVARRLGAKVHSFDYDPGSVECTAELKRRYFPDDVYWKIEEGNVLDVPFLNSLGQFDIVYAWGVLHHTGAMWQALANVVPLVCQGGKLFISIYNSQGILSRYWATLKNFYNQSPKPVRGLIILSVATLLETRSSLFRLVQGQNPLPFKYWKEKKRGRGMSVWHDLVDWVGGYPFEVAKPEEIFDFYRKNGFTLVKLKTCGGGLGCNEFVFIREQRNVA